MELKQIDALNPGRETDALIGEFVMEKYHVVKGDRKGYYDGNLAMSAYAAQPTFAGWINGEGNKYYNDRLPFFSTVLTDALLVLSHFDFFEMIYKNGVYRVKFALYQDAVNDLSFPMAICRSALMVKCNLYNARD